MREYATGRELNENELLSTALDHLAEALGFLFECSTQEGKMLAFMTDSVIKLATVVYRGDCPLNAACDYEKYEEERSENCFIKYLKDTKKQTQANMIEKRIAEINKELAELRNIKNENGNCNG